MIAAIRHNWTAVFGAILLMAAGSSYWAMGAAANNWFMETTRDAGFILSNLQIDGAKRTQKDDILATLDVDDGMPLLAIDLHEIQIRIEALPWVKSATVMRVLPGDLHIQIVEREPYALWQFDGKVRLIDNNGEIITNRGLTEFSSLMLVVGEGGADEVGSLFSMLERHAMLYGRIKTAVRVGNRRWDLIFDNGVRVKLPEDFASKYSGSHAWSKFVRLQQKHRLLEREVSVIDMRIEDRIVMRVTPTGHRQMDGKEWAT